MKDKNLMPLNLQFFAEEGNSESQGNAENVDEGNTGNQNQSNSTGKTFTQDEVNAIGAKEKNQGKSSILKLFGCSSEDEAKEYAEKFKKWQDDQKTEEEKKAEIEKQLTAAAKASENRAVAAENKLAAIQAGVNLESIEDAISIASTKVSEDKTLLQVLEEMKKETKYSGFYTAPTNNGTGSSPEHSRGQGTETNIGERLAKRNTANSSHRSNFFKN